MSEHFLRLSVVLTGFDETELADTGMLETYRVTVCEQIGAENLARLLAALSEADGDPQGLVDPALTEVARAVCGLWYLGVWPGLAPDVCRSLELTKHQEPVRPSAAAYAQGLLWRALGGRAPGTHAPGFGSWAEPPPSAGVADHLARKGAAR